MTYWPDIPYERWKQTHHSLHMWLQIAGKCRLADTPWNNHSWHAAFYVTARGLSSSLIPHHPHSYEITFDLIDHVLSISMTDGRREDIPLHSMPVAKFFARFQAALEALDLAVTLHQTPNEVPNPVPFTEQTEPCLYDPEAVYDLWQALVRIDAVFKEFRTGFLGKSSPVHLFWGSFDLAVTRFSGAKAPLHPGGFPSLPDSVTQEAYSHEVSSAGFWPGGGGIDEPCFYSYAYPVPEGFADCPVRPDQASFNPDLGEFILPYEAVRLAPDPRATLLEFLQSTYEAATIAGGWDRTSLERPIGEQNKVPAL